MKRIYYLLLLIIFSLIIIALLFSKVFLPSRKYKDYETIEYKLNGREYKLLVADNSIKWEKGLMNTKNLEGAQGMIFIFPDKQIRHFWNKNTYLDLDVYWIYDQKVVGKDYLPSILITKDPYTVSSKEKVNKVVEIIK